MAIGDEPTVRRRVVVLAERGDSIEDLEASILALSNHLIDAFKVRHRGLSCLLHHNTRSTRCAVCALARARQHLSAARLAREEEPIA